MAERTQRTDEELYSWFKTGDCPTQEQFWDLIYSKMSRLREGENIVLEKQKDGSYIIKGGYSLATESKSGLMSSEDKSKLNSLSNSQILRLKGVKKSKSELPILDNKVGDLWLVGPSGGASGENNYEEYFWTTELKWELLGKISSGPVDVMGTLLTGFNENSTDQRGPFESNTLMKALEVLSSKTKFIVTSVPLSFFFLDYRPDIGYTFSGGIGREGLSLIYYSVVGTLNIGKDTENLGKACQDLVNSSPFVTKVKVFNGNQEVYDKTGELKKVIKGGEKYYFESNVDGSIILIVDAHKDSWNNEKSEAIVSLPGDTKTIQFQVGEGEVSDISLRKISNFGDSFSGGTSNDRIIVAFSSIKTNELGTKRDVYVNVALYKA